MEENRKKKNTGRNIAIAILVVIALTGIYLVVGLKQYMNQNPRITPYENVVCQAGETLSVEQLAEIEVAKDVKILGISEDTREDTDAKVTEDRQAVYVGSQPGSFQVSVLATGSNHESSEVQVQVTVESDL